MCRPSCRKSTTGMKATTTIESVRRIRRSSCGKKNVGVVMALAAFLSPVAWADEKAQSAERETSRNEQREEVREQVGYQLMTPAERDAYRERMRAAARTVEGASSSVSSTMPGCRRVRRSRGGPAGYADDAGPGHGRRCRDGAWRWHGGAVVSSRGRGCAWRHPLHAVPWPVLRRGAQGSQVLRIFSRLPFSAVKCTHWST